MSTKYVFEFRVPAKVDLDESDSQLYEELQEWLTEKLETSAFVRDPRTDEALPVPNSVISRIVENSSLSTGNG
tara:strand:+ start:378 stop:596 length:219 start_codon:yes stop_codon:yes gene_type:complete